MKINNRLVGSRVDRYFYNINLQIESSSSNKAKLEKLILKRLAGGPITNVELSAFRNMRANIDEHVNSLGIEDIRKLATVFEDAGSFLIVNQIEDGRKYKKFRMEIQKTDSQLMEWVASMFDTTAAIRQRHNRNDSWVAFATGSRAMALVYRMWPYLSEKRQKYIQSILDLLDG